MILKESHSTNQYGRGAWRRGQDSNLRGLSPGSFQDYCLTTRLPLHVSNRVYVSQRADFKIGKSSRKSACEEDTTLTLFVPLRDEEFRPKNNGRDKLGRVSSSVSASLQWLCPSTREEEEVNLTATIQIPSWLPSWGSLYQSQLCLRINVCRKAKRSIGRASNKLSFRSKLGSLFALFSAAWPASPTWLDSGSCITRSIVVRMIQYQTGTRRSGQAA